MEKNDAVNYLINSIWFFGGLYIAFGRGFVRASSGYKYQAKVHLMENWRNRATFEDDKIIFQSYKDCFSKMTYEDFCKIIREKCECQIEEK